METVYICLMGCVVGYRDLLRVRPEVDVPDLGAYRRAYGAEHVPPLVYDRSSVLRPTPYAPWKCEHECMVYSEEVGYKTGSGNIMAMLCTVFMLDREDVPLLTEYEHVTFCGSCKGSNGGCPGFAPRFDMIRPSTDTMYVINITFDMVWSLRYATPGGLRSGYILLQLAYADRLTDRYIRRMLMSLRESGLGYVIGLGNCPGCHTKDCTVRKGGRCSHPEKRMFSMEAVGVDCDELHADFYGEYLPWYYKGTDMMPQYMTRYAGVLTARDVSEVVGDIAQFVVTDKSYVPISDVPELDGYDIELMEIPSGPHKGGHQYAYARQQV